MGTVDQFRPAILEKVQAIYGTPVVDMREVGQVHVDKPGDVPLAAAQV